jgi:hypothetical protein
MLVTSLKITADQFRPFGKTGLRVPPIMFGTSSLGNAFETIPEATKLAICGEWFRHVASPVFIDTAGKYGAGLALEVIGKALDRLDIPPEQVILNNKLAWKRTPLKGSEPAFEPGESANPSYRVVLVFDAPDVPTIRLCRESLPRGSQSAGGDGTLHVAAAFCLNHGELTAVKGKVADVETVEPDAAGEGTLEAGDQGQQRRLARSGRADDGQQLAGVDVQVDVDQRLDGRLAGISLGHAAQLDHSRRAHGTTTRSPAASPVPATSSIPSSYSPTVTPTWRRAPEPSTTSTA